MIVEHVYCTFMGIATSQYSFPNVLKKDILISCAENGTLGLCEMEVNLLCTQNKYVMQHINESEYKSKYFTFNLFSVHSYY